jgi:hypothetical protein
MGGGEPAPKRARFAAAAEEAEEEPEESDYTVQAAEALTFRLVRRAAPGPAALAAELAAGGAQWRAEFYNQVFGEEEEIQGYEGLAVDLWLCGRTLLGWVDVRHATRLPRADDVPRKLREWFAEGDLFTSRAAWEAALAAVEPAPDFSALGERLSQAALPSGAGELRLQRFALATAPPAVRALHRRLQPLLIFEIDGANYIDPEDDKWELVVAVVAPPGGGPTLVAGFATLYNFWAYPDRTRLRLSQVLVLPPFQARYRARARWGSGGRTLTAAVNRGSQPPCRPLPLPLRPARLSPTSASLMPPLPKPLRQPPPRPAGHGHRQGAHRRRVRPGPRPRLRGPDVRGPLAQPAARAREAGGRDAARAALAVGGRVGGGQARGRDRGRRRRRAGAARRRRGARAGGDQGPQTPGARARAPGRALSPPPEGSRVAEGQRPPPLFQC